MAKIRLLLICILVIIATVSSHRSDMIEKRARSFLKKIRHHKRVQQCRDEIFYCPEYIEQGVSCKLLGDNCRKSCGLCSDGKQRSLIGGQTSVLPAVNPSLSSTITENTECGMLPHQGFSKRVFGGKTADPKAWPSICDLIRKGAEGHCAGTLVKNKNGHFYVITAVHCTVDVADPKDVTVRCGVNKLIGDAVFHEQILGVKSVMNHEEYRVDENNDLMHDVAVLELSSQPEENDFVQAACLPRTPADVNERSVVVGWGLIGYEDKYGKISTVNLKELEQPIVSNEECESLWNKNGKHNLDCEKMGILCAGYKEAGKGSCMGDSGGPLYTRRNGRWTLTGVVSFGEPCGKADYVDVYADVYSHLEWIESKINN